MTDFICLVMMAGYWLHFYHVLFPGVKDVKTATPEDFNLLITVINSAEVILYIKKYQGFYLVCFDFWTYFNPFYSVHFRMSKLSKSDWVRQKDNVWQSKHGL